MRRTIRHAVEEGARTSAVPCARPLSNRDLSQQLADLPQLSYEDLQASWRKLHRSAPPGRLSRDLLELGIAWKLQEACVGGHNTTIRRHLKKLAATTTTKGDLSRAPPKHLRPGTKLIREWRGQVHEVLVLDEGYEWRSERRRSLSSIARAISGSHCSGPRFFGVQETKPARSPRSRAVVDRETGDVTAV